MPVSAIDHSATISQRVYEQFGLVDRRARMMARFDLEEATMSITDQWQSETPSHHGWATTARPGKTARQRVQELSAIAAPEFREELTAASRRLCFP